MRKWLQKCLRLRLPRKHQSPHLPSRSSPMEFIVRSCLRSSWQDSTRVLTSRKRRWWCLSPKLLISSNYCFIKRTENTLSMQLSLCQCWIRSVEKATSNCTYFNSKWTLARNVSGLLDFNLIFHVARTMSWLNNRVFQKILGITSDGAKPVTKSIKIQCSQNVTSSWWTVDFLCSFLASVLGLKDHSYKARNGIIIDYFSGFLLYLVHPYVPSSLQTTSN